MADVQILDVPDSKPMWAPQSHYSREMRRWDTPRSQGGMRPDGKEEFPKMVYKAERKDGAGPYKVIDPADEQWSRQNYREVGNPAELAKYLADGWGEDPAQAVQKAKDRDTAISDATAHRHHEDRNMSAAARAEADEVDAEVTEHVPVITPAIVKEVREEKRRRAKA